MRSKKFVCCQVERIQRYFSSIFERFPLIQDGKYKSCEEIFGELEAGASERVAHQTLVVEEVITTGYRVLMKEREDQNLEIKDSRMLH